MAQSGTWNLWVGSFHPMLIISGAWVIGGAALIICEGNAICNALLFVVGFVLVVRFWPVVAGDFDNAVDVIVGLDHFSGKEGTPQLFLLLYCLLPFDFQGAQVPFKVED